MKEYTIELGGIEHTVQLTDEDAKRLGVTAVKASTAGNKSRTADNK